MSPTEQKAYDLYALACVQALQEAKKSGAYNPEIYIASKWTKLADAIAECFPNVVM